VNVHSAYGSHAVFNTNPSWMIRRQVKLFFNLSSAYRTPSLYQLFSEYGNRALKPESAISSEAGFQYFSKNEKFNSRVVAFRRNVKNLVFFFTDPVSFRSAYINQDRQKDHGFELESGYTISKKISVKAWYTYVTGKLFTTVNGHDTAYNNLLRRPASSWGLNLTARAGKHLFLGSSLRIYGKRADTYYDNTRFSNVSVTLDGYLLWDLYAEYGFLKDRLKVFADLRNLSNSRYSEISGFNTMRMNGDGGIRLRFGK